MTGSRTDGHDRSHYITFSANAVGKHGARSQTRVKCPSFDDVSEKSGASQCLYVCAAMMPPARATI